MEKKNEKLGVSFQLPERVTVRQQLAYFSETALARGQELFIRLWMGAKTIVTDWKCEAVPSMDADLDEITDTKATEIVLWVGIEVQNYMDSLDSIPKN